MNPTLQRTIIGNSSAIIKVRELIQKVCQCDANVILLGPSGTGKTLIASLIHQLSPRRNKPFVPVNCGAIPSELLESELFGHEKGAFTGALNKRIGRFELAHEGSIFLDEIGDMPLNMQVKLLRVLQEKNFERVGGNNTILANVRIITATHQNLELAIAERRFREDLYYRLNVFPIEILPLSERKQDIPILIDYFLEKNNAQLAVQQNGKIKNEEDMRFSETALTALYNYSWPGNVRELMNFIERMSILYQGKIIELEDLPAKYLQKNGQINNELSLQQNDPSNEVEYVPTESLNLKDYLADIEKKIILDALEKHSYIVSYAAEYLHIGRTTLIDKIRKYNIQPTQTAKANLIN